MNFKTFVAMSCATGAIAGFAAPAYAQDEGGIQEIIVTAEKREASVQDTPVSVTAVTAQQRDVVGITTIQDLANFTPGMTRTGADRISPRGAGRFTFFLGSDPGVATYADGFYSQNFTLEAYKSPLFIQRTEILRGPQGTLYGRNSMGGSLNVVSARPTDEFQADLRGAVGNYDARKLEGAVSGPITDTLRYRLVAQVDQQTEGFMENYGSSGNEAQWDRTYQEGQLDWDATPWLHFWLRATTSAWDDTMGVEDRLVSYLSPFEAHQFSAPASIVLSPQYNYCNTPGVAAPNPFLGQQLGADECAINGGGGEAPNRAITQNNPYLFEADTRDLSFVHDNAAYVLHTDVDLGNGVNLKYITGFGQYEFGTGGDTDRTGRTDSYLATNAGLPCVTPGLGVFCGNGLLGTTEVFPQSRTDFRQSAKYFSNEINLTNGATNDFQWILGLYQYHEKFVQTISQVLQNQPELHAANLAFYGEDRGGQYARADGSGWTNSYAAFAQGDWAATDTLTATLGLRYTYDEKRGLDVRDLILWNPITFAPGAMTVDLTGVGGPNVVGGAILLQELALDYEDNWDAVTGTAGLQWQPDNETLAYARYSRGYKAGGFSLGTTSSDPFYEPEHVNSYEVGLKRDFGRTVRTNLALFFNDYGGFQFNLGSVNPNTGIAESRAINVDAEAYGAELEVVWEPVDNLVLTAAYGYIHDEITGPGCSVISPGVFSAGCFFDTADTAAVATGAQPIAGATIVSPGFGLWPDVVNQLQSLVGNGLPQTPDNKIAVNANYTFHFDVGSVTVSASGFYTDEISYGVFENPQYTVDSYSTADFRALFNSEDGHFTAIAYVKNAFEEEAFTSNGPLNPGQTYVPGTGIANDPTDAATERGLIYPRTFGVELQFHY